MKPSQSAMEALQPGELPGVELPENQAIWMNDAYQVHVTVFQPTNGEGGELVHMSIKRRDKLALHDWRDLQWIKNQIVGPEEEAFEIYPPESQLVDTSNQYHLWCIRGFHMPIGFRSGRMVSEASVTNEFGANTQRKFAPHVRPRDLAERQAEFVKLASEPGMARRALLGSNSDEETNTDSKSC